MLCDVERGPFVSPLAFKEGYSVAWIFGQTVGDHTACAAATDDREIKRAQCGVQKLNSGSTPKKL